MINFKSYFAISVLAMLSMVIYACYTREQFYTIILFLVSSKVSFLLAGNMIVAFALLFGRVTKSVFFGRLRDIEVELLLDRCKYSITETLLALTIFRHELTPNIILLFGMLLFIKIFHWLANSRLDYLQQLMPIPITTHLRLSSLLTILGTCDIFITYYCVKHTISNGKTVLILFGFEFAVLTISILNYFTRYFLHILDSRFESGLTSKGLYTMLVDLVCDAMKFVLYVIFFCLVFVYYGLPIHIVRDVWMAFNTFHKQLSSFIKYIRLTSNLDSRFPDATVEEIISSGDCLICRENMENAKKLPCGHVFHLDCLRMWLQHQQTCPLCRADIPLVAPTPVPTTVPTPPVPNPPVDAPQRPTDNMTVNNEQEGDTTTSTSTNAANATTTTPSTPIIGTQSQSQSLSQIGSDSCDLPAFFLVQCVHGVMVLAAPAFDAPQIRCISQGTLVFAMTRFVNPDGYTWLELPDGWALECLHTMDIEDTFLVPFSSEDFGHEDKLQQVDNIDSGRSLSQSIGLSAAELNSIPRPAVSDSNNSNVNNSDVKSNINSDAHVNSSVNVSGNTATVTSSSSGSIVRTFGGPGLRGDVRSAMPGGQPFTASLSGTDTNTNTYRDRGLRNDIGTQRTSNALRPSVLTLSQSQQHNHSQQRGYSNSDAGGNLLAVQRRMEHMAVAMSELQEELAMTQALLHGVIYDMNAQTEISSQSVTNLLENQSVITTTTTTTNTSEGVDEEKEVESKQSNKSSTDVNQLHTTTASPPAVESATPATPVASTHVAPVSASISVEKSPEAKTKVEVEAVTPGADASTTAQMLRTSREKLLSSLTPPSRHQQDTSSSSSSSGNSKDDESK